MRPRRLTLLRLSGSVLVVAAVLALWSFVRRGPSPARGPALQRSSAARDDVRDEVQRESWSPSADEAPTISAPELPDGWRTPLFPGSGARIVHGMVVDAVDGTPLAARVEFAARWRTISRRSDGHYQLAVSVDAGALTIAADGFEPAAVEVAAGAEPIDLGRTALVRRDALRIVVVDDQGQRLDGALIYALDALTSEPPMLLDFDPRGLSTRPSRCSRERRDCRVPPADHRDLDSRHGHRQRGRSPST